MLPVTSGVTLGKLLSLLGLDFLSAKLSGKERGRASICDTAIYASHRCFMYGYPEVCGQTCSLHRVPLLKQFAFYTLLSAGHMPFTRFSRWEEWRLGRLSDLPKVKARKAHLALKPRLSSIPLGWLKKPYKSFQHFHSHALKALTP